MAADVDVEAIERRATTLKSDKYPWLEMWGRVSQYVMLRQDDFSSPHSAPIFLDDVTFDNSAPRFNKIMASSMRGALWPNAGDTFDIDPSDYVIEVDDTQEVKDHFAWMTKQVQAVFNDAQAGFNIAHEKYWNDQGGVGTSGIAAFETEDRNRPVRFQYIDVKRSWIAEGANGFVDTVYTEREYTIRQLVQEYKIQNVSKEVKDRFDKKDLEYKVMVRQIIEPRSDRVVGSLGNQDMPVASVHLEMATKHVLIHSGYPENPAFVTRFSQVEGEVYGRSPSTDSMGDILELNGLREALMLATEIYLKPTMIVNDESVLSGDGSLDTSADGILVRKEGGRMDNSRPAAEPLYTVGEINSSYKRAEVIRDDLRAAYYNDSLLDLNNKTRQTLGEADIRNELRQQMLGTPFTRQITEMYDPLISRVFRIMFVAGLLGVAENSTKYFQLKAKGINPKVLPKAIQQAAQQGEEYFKVSFKSPAYRIMQLDRLKGLQSTVGFCVGNFSATGNPEHLDPVDFDEAELEYAKLAGGPSKVMRARDAIRRIRADRSSQQQAAQDAQLNQAQSETAKNQGQAAAFASKAGLKLA